MSWRRGVAVGASSAAVLLVSVLLLGGPAGALASGPTTCSSGAVTCIDKGLEAYMNTLAPGASTPGFDATQVLGASSPLAQGSSDAKAIEQAFTSLVPTITSKMSTAASNSVTAGDYESALNNNLDGDSN